MAKKKDTITRRLDHSKIRRLKKILKRLDSIEETPANASQIRAIENRIDDLLHR